MNKLKKLDFKITLEKQFQENFQIMFQIYVPN
jgi:hypothetical protein